MPYVWFWLLPFFFFVRSRKNYWWLQLVFCYPYIDSLAFAFLQSYYTVQAKVDLLVTTVNCVQVIAQRFSDEVSHSSNTKDFTELLNLCRVAKLQLWPCLRTLGWAGRSWGCSSLCWGLNTGKFMQLLKYKMLVSSHSHEIITQPQHLNQSQAQLPTSSCFIL